MNFEIVRLFIYLLISFILKYSLARIEEKNGLFTALKPANQQRQNHLNNSQTNFLIVISYDGFRNEYMHRGVTPNLLKFQREGVKAPYMKNVFPTKTFTNHHSISTGSYPEFHGVLGNNVFDRKEGNLEYGYNLFHYNNSLIPIWTLNEMAGGRSGCSMWPSSNFDFHGFKCTYTQNYTSNIPLKERVDKMMGWLTGENPPNLVMFYSEQPDKLAHIVGPNSENITRMVASLDEITGYIQDELQRHNLSDIANVIHLSDHGMAGVNPPHFINLTDILASYKFKYYGSSPVLQIVPENLSELPEVKAKLEKAAVELETFDVYDRYNILKRWHMYAEQRFGPIVVVAKDDYAFDDMWLAAEAYRRDKNVPITDTSEYGLHGYDNEDDLMHALFMAKGVDFKQSAKIDVFDSVELYDLFAKILNINTTAVRSKYLKADDVLSVKYLQKLPVGTIVLLVIMLVLVFSVMVFGIVKYRKRRNYNL